MEWLTTSTILDDLRDFNNDLAWRRLADRFRRPVASFARRLGLTAADADDVAQESLVAFAEGYRNGHYDRQRGRLSRWLFGIAYRQILREQQRRARREVQMVTDGRTSFWAGLPDESTAGATWDAEWEQALLRECIARVQSEFESSTLRAFELVVRDDRPAAEVARELNVPIKSIYNAKHRVIKRIRELRDELDDTA